LTVSDAVRILLTRIAKEGGLPAGLTADPDAYDAWFRAKVRESLDDTRPSIPHQQVMDEAQALIDRKRRAGSSAREADKRMSYPHFRLRSEVKGAQSSGFHCGPRAVTGWPQRQTRPPGPCTSPWPACKRRVR
jgi:DNA-damage-inducible protein J